jgi:hypothetical protein
MAGNLMKFGFDLAGLEQQKQDVLKLYQSLFTDLTALEKNAVSPMNMSGLTQLNEAVRASNIGVKELTTNVTALNAALSTNKQLTSTVSSVTKSVNVSNSSTNTNTSNAANIKAANDEEKREIAERKKNLALAKSSIDDYNKSVEQAEKERIAQQKADDKQIAQAEKQRLSDEKAAAKESEKIQKERAAALKKYNADLLAQKKAEEDSIKKNAQAEAAAAKSHAQQSQTIANAYTLQKQKVKELENEYILLRSSAGKSAPITIAKFDELKQAKNDLGEMSGAIEKAESSSFGFGNALKGVYNQVRILAYVIPGIGIAGIFNLAFEAIENALRELNLFGVSTEEFNKFEKELNETLSKQIDLRQDLYDIALAQSKLAADASQHADKINERDKARGFDAVTQMKNELEALKQRKDELEALSGGFTVPDAAFKDNKRLAQSIEEDTKLLQKQQDLLDKIKNPKPPPRRDLTPEEKKKEGPLSVLPNLGPQPTEEEQQARIDKIQSRLDNEKKIYKQREDVLTEYADVFNQFVIKEKDLIKLEEDEARRVRLDNDENIYGDAKRHSEKVLEAQRSNEKQLLGAVDEEYYARATLIRQKEKEILDNINSTEADKIIAVKDATASILDAEQKRGQDRRKIIEDFQKRDLEAVTEISLAESKQRESTDQEEYKNIKEGFQTRLNALGKYLSERKLQIEDNYQKTLGLESFQYATPEEHKQVETDRTVAKQQLIASAASEIASITTSYLREITKDLNDENDAWLLTTDSEEQYTEALILLNEQFEKGKINADQFQRAKDKLNQGYKLAKDLSNVKAYDEILKNDKEFADARKKEVGQAAFELIAAYASGDKDVINNAKTKYDLLVQANDDANKKIEKDTLASNKAKLKYEEDENNGLIDDANAKKVDWVKIEHALYEAVTEIIDARLQYELAAIETRKQAVDEMYNSEIEAIKRSSLAAKEKTAYDIQLQAQKMQADKNAAKQERKLKHDEAVLDKALAVADIIWNTEKAISKDLGFPGKVITDAILGGIALAKVVATPVPALKYGVEDWKGGKALFGEAGSELVKEPGKKPYIQSTPTVKFLPQHTEVIPMYEIPTISENKKDDSWQQTRYLASMFKKGQNKTATKIVNNINIDLSFELYKQKIFQG